MQNPIKLIRNAEVYAPELLGKQDVLICGDKIAQIQPDIELAGNVAIETINAAGKILVPGFIDAHVHILGGGGEGSCRTRTPEIMLSDLTRSGITTVVGLLGTDGFTRSIQNLVAKAKGLTEEGVTAHCYTGSYQIPVRTLTETIQDDLLFIDRVIGVKIALSDHRSTQPTVEEVARIAAAARVGGMLSGKAGVVQIHMGDGDRRLSFLEQIIAETEIPATQFIPTHLNRNPELFEAAIAYARDGGLMDLTTSTRSKLPHKTADSCDSLLKRALQGGVPIERISFSSDGQGSLPVFDDDGAYVGLEVAQVSSLFDAVRDAVRKQDIHLETALQVATCNPARNLKLNNKGVIAAGRDSDLMLLNQELEIDTVIAMGQIMIRDGDVAVVGTFEKA